MIDEVRICGHKLFYRHMWRVLINGKKWWYLEKTEIFVDEHGYATPRKDMPLAVQIGFIMAWENDWVLYEKYSRRSSYGWQLLICNLQEEGRHIVVCSRGRRMGIIEVVDVLPHESACRELKRYTVVVNKKRTKQARKRK